ncbi:formate dehydrogenase subunit alpha [Halobacillus halophilus]|uniref:Probable formate dehydrogenase alpha subunit n=1 Tax=Halobacillus halophilus (strain ATCC 35676 / DSM 2266 / JCM 20832 / KCTC 3685 / LMG 17431 / NBRC 102448 / NCIMB 2269) TaxID=866895 RepID=I0JLP6_HALH3|nr:formate dehydrogenase subunit alpha [Halobacillus halophilus]ASF39171.1 formate dehydrogenase subunit alpha [Halobacillus halophilus]CCG45066.1 probable formate dehydrogenase alpha subunit [Halobacillus halophilus DSM 2266]
MNDRDHTVVTINGTEYLADPGQNLLDLINTTDEDVPQICYNESLGPIQTCDTCMVQVNGEIQRACGMKVEAGMRVQTKLPHVHKAQKEALDRVLEKHELYCTVCDYNNGDCEIHNTMADFGLDHQSRPFQPTSYNRDDSGSFYRYDPDQCILCGRCVEVCQDVQVNETLTIDWERQEPRVIWDNDVPIDQSSCVNCGQCSTVCPCNAMMEVGMEKEAGFLTDQQPGILKSMIDLTKKVETGYGPLFAVSDSEAAMREERIDKTKTVCTYCGVGCSFDVWTKDREILKVEPHPESPANGISTCVKGKFGWDYVNSDDRLQKPLIRRGDTFEEVEWEEAIAYAVRRMNEIKAEKGADHLGFISSSKATNEESYLMQKISRQVIGTNNVDNCSRYCQAPATKGLFRTVGYGGDSGSIDDLAKSELVMTIGSNTAESHPVLASRIKRSQKLFGQKLFVFDLRKHEMAKRADRFFSPKSGTDLVWISAVTKYILDQGWEDQNFLNDWVNGFEDYRESLEPFTLEYAANMTGFSEEDLKDLAKEIVEAKTVSVCWAMGVTQHMLGSDTSTAISNLLLITGNYGKPGTGAYPLRGHNNVQGCSDFGSQPDQYPGYESVTDDEVRKRYEEAWGVDLPHEKGMDNHEMIEAIHDGNLSMMYVIGEDTGIVDANINYVTAAFEKLDFFIVQDLFLTRTAEYADVVLPASPSLEKEGTFTNTERRIQRLYQSLEPLQGTKPDWEILQDIAKEAGFDWNYKHPSEIMDEAASLAPLFAGVTYDRLEGYDSLQWPVAKDGTDEPLLFVDGFPFEDGKARLYPLDFELMYDTTEEYDLHVNNGRLLEHFHEGNMTYRSAGISRKTPDSFVEVSEELAKERGIEEGARVKLISESGEATGTVTVTDRVKGKELFVPMNGTGKSAVNLLTDNRVDKDTDTPAYKEIAVKMKVLKKKGKSPIPDNNHRRGNPVPQISVKVEEKWKRDDYEFPGSQVKR